jgi:F0F1-type ATP synthase epsilon subunit
MNNEPTFKTKILNTEKVLFEGNVKSVSSENETAKFDILPGHTNFISIIKDRMELITAENEKKEFNLEYGIVMVYENVLNVYLGIKQTF